MSPRYVELQVTSHFSFLRGASSCEELFAQAARLGIEALGIADRNSLAGVVRAHEAAREAGLRLIVGCRLDLVCGMSVLVYPIDRAAYARLCRLLSLGKKRAGKKRAGKGRCHLEWTDLASHGEGLVAILVPDDADAASAGQLQRLGETFGDRAFMALTLRRRPNDQLRLWQLSNLAAQARVACVVTNDVLYHVPERRILQDVVTAIRHNITVDELGFRRERFADRYLKPPQEMHRLFAAWPEALENALKIAERCRFSLDELKYQYPEERADPRLNPQQTLEKLVWEGAAERYQSTVPARVRKSLEHELALIERLDYAPYFLTVHNIVRYARSQNILCQGRGSAANSAVCYVLGITAIDPAQSDLLFERFVSEERREPPDIDVDFEHERREQVIQWVYETYGRDRAALCATVVRYRVRGALRDVGKALGLPEDMTRALSTQTWRRSQGVDEKHVATLDLNADDRRLKLALALARELIGAPRHLSQHPGGFVLSHDRLDNLVPIEPAAMNDRQVIEWDKNDIDALRFMKVDVLGLGMLSCMRRAFSLLAAHKRQDYTLATIPQEDSATYAMIRKADTLGTFQIESRAQMSMLPRLRPKTFYDLVIQVAIVRPGPIQGDMVHPYLRRRNYEEEVVYPKPELKAVLGKTLGVPLFQEQAMRVAIECAGFSPGEADQLRRAMATFKNVGTISTFGEKLISGMVKNGYASDFAERTFRQLEGFGSYGFPESHAASFALIAYASSWIKCHHPDVFCCALLNSQPMGFYAPAQIVRDAQAHGIEVRPVCINASQWDSTLEPCNTGGGYFAVRLGLCMVKKLGKKEADRLVKARISRPYRSVDDLWRRAEIPAAAMAELARADAFRPALGLARREALWTIRGLRNEPLPLFAAAARRQKEEARPEQIEPQVRLARMADGGEVVEDYGHTGLTLRSHPVSFLRGDLTKRKIFSCSQAMTSPAGHMVQTAGLVLVRQRPGTAKGVIFITLEDETGIANLVVWPKVFEAYRSVILNAGMIGIRGRIQRADDVVHIIVRHVVDLSRELASIGQRDGSARLCGDHADITRPSDETIRVRSRNFH